MTPDEIDTWCAEAVAKGAERVEGGVLWQIALSPIEGVLAAAGHRSFAGWWYGETWRDDRPDQTQLFQRREQAAKALLHDEPCSCGCGCGMRETMGYQTCSSCAFDRHGPTP